MPEYHFTDIVNKCSALVLSYDAHSEAIFNCVLRSLMLKVAVISIAYKTHNFGSFNSESKRNDKKLCFS
ncbi:hypothetical protein DLR60_17035 [Vibrio tarriae]|nr:hypothetical protein DLR60_17035 [Vibrio tarriae]